MPDVQATSPPAPLAAVWGWIDRNILGLGREMRLSYLPPLMVYVAAGISGLTGIVGTFFVKDYLGLSAEFLAGLGFWAGLPWALKMPLGHLVDLIWKRKAGLVYLGAAVIATSLLIMLDLLAKRTAMEHVMTAEAVPRVDESGRPVPPEERRPMHATMQTLGRVAIIGGSVLVAAANVWLFAGAGAGAMPEAQKVATYIRVYELALLIPAVSILGVMLAGIIRRRDDRRLIARGFSAEQAEVMLHPHPIPPPVNWWILGGGLAFTAISLSVGLGMVPAAQEIVFAASMAIVLFLMWKLVGRAARDEVSEPALRRGARGEGRRHRRG
jgi:hypothetical protein